MSFSIVPRARLEGLESFYSSGNGVSLTVADDEMSGGLAKNASDIMKGQWLTTQFRAGAEKLFVIQWILPLDQHGACELPVIAPREEYVEAFRATNHSRIEVIQRALDMRQRALVMS